MNVQWTRFPDLWGWSNAKWINIYQSNRIWFEYTKSISSVYIFLSLYLKYFQSHTNFIRVVHWDHVTTSLPTLNFLSDLRIDIVLTVLLQISMVLVSPLRSGKCPYASMIIWTKLISCSTCSLFKFKFKPSVLYFYFTNLATQNGVWKKKGGAGEERKRTKSKKKRKYGKKAWKMNKKGEIEKTATLLDVANSTEVLSSSSSSSTSRHWSGSWQPVSGREWKASAVCI